MADFLASYNAVLVLMGINAVLAYSMYAVLIAGQLSLAQAAFASIAAYSTAVVTIEAGAPFLVVVLMGLLVGAVLAVIIGLPVLRLRGVFLAIATLGFGEVVRIVAINLDVTGGAQGLRGIPKVVGLPHAWIAVVLAAWFFARLGATRLGRGFAAVREDEIAAEVSGIDVVRYRMYSFVVSGAIAGLSGVLFAHFTRFISPDQFGFLRALDALLYAIVGGTAHWIGPLLGASFLTLLPEVQREFGFDQAWIRPAISGSVLLIVILFLPEGLVGFRRLWRRDRRPTEEARAERGGRAAAPASVPAEGLADAADAADAGSTADRAEEPPAADRHTDGDTTGEVLVELRGLSKDYGGVVALSDVDLQLRRGEVVGLIGPNGAGKTTLVNVVTGLTDATSGTVHVADETLDERTRAHEVARLGVARTFQQVRLFEGLTVRENVLIGGHLHAPSTFLRRLVLLPSARRDEADTIAAADEALATAGLAGMADLPASALSYGHRRRLEIARALAGDPRVLVLDEPAAGMNHVEAADLGELIASIAARGITVLLIEHNVRLVMNTCSRVVVLDFGEVIADGSPQQVARDPDVVAAYLGGDTTETETP